MNPEMISVCPVCGTARRDKTSFDCGECGFRHAFFPYFAGEKSRAFFLEAVNAAKKKQKENRLAALSDSDCFFVGENAIAFLSPFSHTLHMIFGNGNLQTEEKVLQFSAAERNYAVLYQNGTVRVFGEDNSYGQKNTAAWKAVRKILSAPNCTYGITESGDVLTAGAPISSDVKEWKTVQTLVCGDHLIVGLKKDGKLLLAGESAKKEELASALSLKKIREIAVSGTCIAALDTVGAVHVFGKAGEARMDAAKWKNIKAIAADRTYIFGLSENGEVLLAGACKAFLDKGRSAAAAWKQVLSVSCNASGVGALCSSGVLYFAGMISGDIQKMTNIWNASIKPILDAETGGNGAWHQSC